MSDACNRTIHKIILVKRNKYLEVSISLSLISIIVTVFINSQIAKAYLKSDGKTRALFGLNELLQFGYQYYVIIPGIISLIFAILSLKINTQGSKKISALLLSLFAIVIVFARIWRLFI